MNRNDTGLAKALGSLPIAAVLPDLQAALAANACVVLQADPGAGKSTIVPLALLDAPWLAGRKILLLQPRRIAARSVAERMAALLGETVGETVGYRMRLARKIGPRTRIEVLTEGMLTRRLQNDPLLEDVGCILFDEFHERSLQADLGLALARDVQKSLRDDLRLLPMSATLDGDALAALLDDAPVVRSRGRSHPVTTHYRPPAQPGPPSTDRIAHVIAEALATTGGDLLVFLPGKAEIERLWRRLNDSDLPEGCAVLPLHGGLDLDRQRAALRPAPPGGRKIVLASAIAETSLTIDGIAVVVDTGLERHAEFDPRRGLTRLVTVAASRASADQRRGRAGRLGPGHCYRLWHEADHARRPARTQPEIERADLAPLALELLTWGVDDPARLDWLTPPPAAPWRRALELLRQLDAIDANGKPTRHGEALSQLGLHPRLGHMVIVAQRFGAGALACRIAALMQERSPFRGDDPPADFVARLSLLRANDCPAGADRNLLQRARQQAARLLRQLGIEDSDETPVPVGGVCALAYPDRIGQRRGGHQRPVWRLSGGGAAFFPEPNEISDSEYLVVIELDGRDNEAKIFSATAIDRATIEEWFADRIESVESLHWDEKRLRVVAEKQRRFGRLALEQSTAEPKDPAAVKALLLEAIRRHGHKCLPWSPAARSWRQRLDFLSRLDGRDETLPDLSDQALLETLPRWLGPWLDGIDDLAGLEKLDLLAILQSSLSWEQQQRIERLAPSHVTVPSGRRLPIDYDGEVPTLAVPIQEMFSARETPTIADGRVRLRLQLLSPARRPVQITNDIAGFWAGSYAEVRKEMKGRYPKHHWPEDPLAAAPHRGVRRPPRQ